MHIWTSHFLFVWCSTKSITHQKREFLGWDNFRTRVLDISNMHPTSLKANSNLDFMSSHTLNRHSTNTLSLFHVLALLIHFFKKKSFQIEKPKFAQTFKKFPAAWPQLLRSLLCLTLWIDFPCVNEQQSPLKHFHAESLLSYTNLNHSFHYGFNSVQYWQALKQTWQMEMIFPPCSMYWVKLLAGVIFHFVLRNLNFISHRKISQAKLCGGLMYA